MHLNADFSQRALVQIDENDWMAFPVPRVRRRMLNCIGEEVTRATSIVRFDPGSVFSRYTHDSGEECIVLDSTFQDESGDFPKGFYGHTRDW